MSCGRYLMLSLAFFAIVLPALPAANSLDDAQVQAYYDQALGDFQSGRYQAALESLKSAAKLDPKDLHVNLLMGVAYCSIAEFEKAKSPLKAVLKQDPGHVDAGANLGIAYFETGRWKDARAAFETVLKSAPGHAEARINLGILELKEENWKAARDHFEEATRVAPKSARAWVGLSDSLAWLGLNSAAVDARREALKLNPEDDNVRLKLAGALYTLGDTKAVLEILKGLKNKDQAEARFLTACSNYRAGLFSDAETDFLRALVLKPDYPQARLNLGITYYDRGDFEKAIEQFEAVLEDHPQHERAIESLRVAREIALASLLKKGSQAFVADRFQEAQGLWKRAQAIDPKNKVARDLLKRAQTRLGDSAAESAMRGNAALAKGDLATAVVAWHAALEMNPKNAQALEGLKKVADRPAELTAVYKGQVAAALMDESFARAHTLADEARSINAKVGDSLLADITLAEKKRAAGYIKNGNQARDKGQWRKAVSEFEKAFALSENDRELRLKVNKARVSLRQEVDKLLENASATDDAAKAHELYRKVLSLDPDNSRAGSGAQRTAKSARISSVDPEKVNQVYYQGVYAYANGDTDEALGYWEKALSLDPKHEQTLAAVSEAQKKLKALKALGKK